MLDVLFKKSVVYFCCTRETSFTSIDPATYARRLTMKGGKRMATKRKKAKKAAPKRKAAKRKPAKRKAAPKRKATKRRKATKKRR
jgi:hypothetical protein